MPLTPFSLAMLSENAEATARQIAKLIKIRLNMVNVFIYSQFDADDPLDVS